jgi:hypothetical protein
MNVENPVRLSFLKQCGREVVRLLKVLLRFNAAGLQIIIIKNPNL